MALELGPVIGKVGGAQLEEIPVSMSGPGSDEDYPLTTVDAGDGAAIVVIGTMEPGHTSSTSRPHLLMGSYTHEEPYPFLTGPEGIGVGGFFTGTIEIIVCSRSRLNVTTFDGIVYVAHF